MINRPIGRKSGDTRFQVGRAVELAYSKANKVLRSTAFSPLLHKGDRFTSKGLKDSEARALALLSLMYPSEIYFWELRHFLDTKASQGKDPQLGLLLDCRTFQEAILRLQNMSPNLQMFLARSFENNLASALRKLRIKSSPSDVRFPQRKRGYNDKGSIDKDSAWKRARPFYLDTENQYRHYQAERDYRDAIDFLRGFTD